MLFLAHFFLVGADEGSCVRLWDVCQKTTLKVMQCPDNPQTFSAIPNAPNLTLTGLANGSIVVFKDGLIENDGKKAAKSTPPPSKKVKHMDPSMIATFQSIHGSEHVVDSIIPIGNSCFGLLQPIL